MLLFWLISFLPALVLLSAPAMAERSWPKQNFALTTAPAYDASAPLCDYPYVFYSDGPPVRLNLDDGRVFQLCAPALDLRMRPGRLSESLVFLNPARIPGLHYRGDFNSLMIYAFPYETALDNNTRITKCTGETVRIGPARYTLCSGGKGEAARSIELIWRPDLNPPGAFPEAETMPPHSVGCYLDPGPRLSDRFGICFINVDFGAGFIEANIRGSMEVTGGPVPIAQIPLLASDIGQALRVIDVTNRPQDWISGAEERNFGPTE
ncbi:hypothetical protein FGG78_19235 [Thioclava sp. BHET1]|nr:hypothetical protein FGG78_19235 [Thioclava sp. BHET1]